MRIFHNKLYIYVAILFVFVLTFSLLTPMGGDDWGMYLTKGMGLTDIFELTKNFYMTWEGRISARIFNLLVMPHEILWAIINAFILTLLFYFLYKILGSKDKLLPLILMGILFVDYETYAQIYVWHTGNIFYLYPIVYIFFLIYLRKNIILGENIKISKWNYLLVPLTFIFSMFVESVTVSLIFVCLLNTIFYYINTKKIDKSMLLCFVAALIVFCIMYFSPGTNNRINMDTTFISLNILEKIIYNIPNFINYTFIKNSFIVILMVIVMCMLICKKLNNKICKYLFLIFTTIPAILTVFINTLSHFISLSDILLKILNPENLFIIIYWILFGILFMFLIIDFLKADKIIWYFLILIIVSAGSMMLSPVWGGRTACFTTFLIFLLLMIIIKKLDLKILENSKTNFFLVFINLTFIVCFTIYSIYIYNLNNDRTKYINYQLENDAKEYEIILLPSYYAWNLNVWGSEGDFAYSFKKAYGIPKEAKLIFLLKNDTSIKVDKLKTSEKRKY